jgi:hypothetical protein
MPGTESMADRVIDELERLASKSVYTLSDWWLETVRPVRGAESELQIDIEDAYFFGKDPPTVALEWSDVDAVPYQAPHYRITPLSDPAETTVEGPFMRQDELRWEFHLPKLNPGTYRIETSPSPHGGDPQLSTEAIFDVFDDATMEKEADHA